MSVIEERRTQRRALTRRTPPKTSKAKESPKRRERSSSERSGETTELSDRARTQTDRARRRTDSSGSRNREVQESSAEESSSAPETSGAQETRAERERREEREHLRNFDRHFEVFDNPGGGDTDGTVSDGDLEKVAEGDYDRERAEERLRDAGVPADEISDRLDSIEDTANFLLDNDSVRERIDVANDDDGRGDADGKISRGDLDRVMIEVEAEEREARVREAESAAQQPPSEEHIAEAQDAVTRWSEPGALSDELESRSLVEFSEAELDALAAVNENNPEAKRQVEAAILANIDEAESLEDLPQGDAFNFLLDQHVTGREIDQEDPRQANNPAAVAQRQLASLVRGEIEGSLDNRLNDRKGDDELDLALERVSGDLEDLAIDNPALAQTIQEQAESTFADYSDEFTDVARADDNFLQKANHAVTGGLRDGVGFLADGFRFGVDITARISSAPTRLAGRVANFGLDVGGRVAGAGLDAVGADGAADNVRSVTDRAGDLLQDGADFVADQNENFTRGLGESVAGAAEGITYAVTDPKGAVEGLAQVVQDPSLLIEGYRETAREHGVAGAAGQLTGDVLLTVFTGGGGAAARGSAAAGRVASIAGRGGRFSSFVARNAGRSQNFLDDVVRAGGTARYVTGRGAAALDDVRRVLPDRPSSSRLLDEALDGAGDAPRVDLADPGPVRSAASRATRGANDAIRGSDVDSFSRRAARVREDNPRLYDDVDTVREQIEGLRGAEPSAIEAFLNDPAQLNLARRIDQVSGGRRPSQVGDLVLSGREDILNYLRSNFDSLDPDQVRRITRGIFADSDPAGGAYITRLNPTDQVFRAFESSADNAKGSYFGRRRDRRLSTPEQIANNALPERNLADRGVVARVGGEDPSLALVTRVGSQVGNEGFSAAARGGGWQLQFLDNTDLAARLKEVVEGASELPDGIVRHNPTPNPFPFGPSITSIIVPQLDEIYENTNES